MDFGTAGAPSRSWMSAAWTTSRTAARWCRRRCGACVADILPASKPQTPPLSVVFTLWLSPITPARTGLAPLQFPRLHGERKADRLQQARCRASRRNTAARSNGAEVLRQLDPLAAGRRNVKVAFHHLPPADRSLRGRLTGAGGMKARNQHPFPIRHVACMARSSPADTPGERLPVRACVAPVQSGDRTEPTTS